MKKNILIVVAHPDDEVLGCGGMIAKYSKSHNIYSCILSGDVEARTKRPEIEVLKRNIEQTEEILGIKKTFLGTFPNIAFNNVDHLKLVGFIEKIILEIQPEYIFTHHHNDLNNDHYHTSIACQAASRFYQRRDDIVPLNSLFFMEVLSSTEWAVSNTHSLFIPNTFIELSKEEFDKKMEALRAYTGIMRDRPHPRSVEVLESLAILRGSQAGVNLAESFQLAFSRFNF